MTSSTCRRRVEALAHYRRLRDQQGWGWGNDELPEFFRLARFSRLGDLTDALAVTGGDWPAAIRRVAAETPAPGLVVLDLDAGGTVTPRVGAPRLACAGRPVTLDVVVDSLVDTELDVAGTRVRVEAGGAAVVTVDVDGPALRVGALEVAGAVEVRPAASLRVRGSAWSRWSVVDEAGGGCWPEGVPPKHDGRAPAVLPRSGDGARGARGVVHGHVHARPRVRGGDERPSAPTRASTWNRSASSTRPPRAGARPTCTCT